jgi:hypothetical protein
LTPSWSKVAPAVCPSRRLYSRWSISLRQVAPYPSEEDKQKEDQRTAEAEYRAWIREKLGLEGEVAHGKRQGRAARLLMRTHWDSLTPTALSISISIIRGMATSPKDSQINVRGYGGAHKQLSRLLVGHPDAVALINVERGDGTGI